jgi:nucleoside 2-deoxyribosyltransferase
MTFYSKMKILAGDLESRGFQVFVPTQEEIDFNSMRSEEKIRAKKQYIREHMERIRGSDAVIIANYSKNGIGGYVGPNTLIEIAFAEAFGKPMYILEIPEQQPCFDELGGFDFTLFKSYKSIKSD